MPAYDAALPPAEAALALVPADATTVTVTDFDRSRAELGVPDLTSDSLMTDRSGYWERARTETVLLAEGVLRGETSRLEIDHGFTQDDVDWEAHWTAPDGPGWALALRPGLDLDRVRRALRVDVPALAGAALDGRRRLLGVGLADEGEATWGDRPEVSALLPEEGVTSVLYRDSCVPAAADRDLEALHGLDALTAFSLAFTDGLATARLGTHRADTFLRADLAEHWPTGDFTQVLTDPVADPSTGRIGLRVHRAPAAAALALTGELPFAVCAGAPAEAPVVSSPSGL